MSFKTNNQYFISSMTSINEYYTKLVTLKNITFTDGWGWFIDIESNYQEIFPNKYKKQTLNHLHLPTINEMPSLRSFNSMRNLHEDSMFFKMDEELEKKNKYKYTYIKWAMHSVCILGVIWVFYMSIFL
jgi:hypothetical protein